MTFIEKFQNKIKEIDKVLVEDIVPISQEIRYNVHQRTLPGLGTKRVALNVSYEEAKLLLKSTHKKTVRTSYDFEEVNEPLLPNGVQSNDSLIFYDIIPTDAALEEQDPLYNNSKITKEN